MDVHGVDTGINPFEPQREGVLPAPPPHSAGNARLRAPSTPLRARLGRTYSGIYNYNVTHHRKMRIAEKELKHQRALMQQDFARMEKRFEQIDRRRFEDTIKRHDQHFFWLVGFIAALRFL